MVHFVFSRACACPCVPFQIDDFVRLAVGGEMSGAERKRAMGSPMLKELSSWLAAQGAACKQVMAAGRVCLVADDSVCEVPI